MIDFGTVRPGTKLYIPFATYDSNDPSASVTCTGLATTDIEVYKDGGMTQRGSDNGYALIDTDGIDIDGQTGLHCFSIDLSDNTTAGFYAAGSQYWVWVASITVDGATVNFIAATFRIGYPGAIRDTTIATLASQTSFTLTDGPADNNALIGCTAVIHDVASAVQIAIGVVSAYTGATKTVTLAADPGIFTMAAGDNISFYPPSNVKSFTAGAINAAAIADAAIDNATFAADVGSTAYASNIIALAVRKVLDELNIDHLAKVATSGADMTTEVADNTVLARILANGDTSGFDPSTMGLLKIAADAAAVLADTGTDGVVVTAGSKTGYALSATGLDLVVKLKALLDGTPSGSVVDDDNPDPSATAFETDLAEASNDHYNGAFCVFYSGALAGQSRKISDYDGTTKVLTVAVAFTEAPAAGDDFLIIGRSE